MGGFDLLEAACKDKSSGDDCTAVQGGTNRTIVGTCFSGAPAGVTDGPPLHCRMMHPAEVACRHKSEKDECEFSRPGLMDRPGAAGNSESSKL